MNILLLENDLRDSGEGSEVQTLARARTITVLRRLDPSRKTTVINFLVEAELIQSVGEGGPIIGLGGAELSDANLSGIQLSGASLTDANLHDINLGEANLSDADLRGAELDDAILDDADLNDANLRNAHLSHANLSRTRVNRGQDNCIAATRQTRLSTDSALCSWDQVLGA
jgi:uncharacterized protein YjbI with pentapeptide repeats